MDLLQDNAAERLADAKRQMQATLAAQIGIATRESEARRSPSDFAAWRAERDAVSAELERLKVLVPVLEIERDEQLARAAEAAKREAAERLRKRIPEKRRANEELSRLIRATLHEIEKLAVPLIQQVVASAIGDAEINREIGDLGLDLSAVVGADTLARSSALIDQREVSRETVEVWVKSGSDFIIEDETLVEEIHNRAGEPTGKGQYLIGSRFNCERRKVDRVGVQRAVATRMPEPLWKMRVPLHDRPGFAYDGARCATALDALQELKLAPQRNQQPEREIEIVIVPKGGKVRS